MSKINFFKKNNFFYWIYKLQKIYKNKIPNYHYGEFAEDIMVNRILRNYKNGTYIDIGAYHPIKGSLTYKFQRIILMLSLQQFYLYFQQVLLQNLRYLQKL